MLEILLRPGAGRAGPVDLHGPRPRLLHSGVRCAVCWARQGRPCEGQDELGAAAATMCGGSDLSHAARLWLLGPDLVELKVKRSGDLGHLESPGRGTSECRALS